MACLLYGEPPRQLCSLFAHLRQQTGITLGSLCRQVLRPLHPPPKSAPQASRPLRPPHTRQNRVRFHPVSRERSME